MLFFVLYGVYLGEMEEELKCPACRQFLREPILLQCAHSYCRECALAAQVKINSAASGNAPPFTHCNNAISPPGSSSNSGNYHLAIFESVVFRRLDVLGYDFAVRFGRRRARFVVEQYGWSVLRHAVHGQ